MNALQIIGLVLGAIALAANQLTGSVPQYASYFAISGSIASALLVALHHQAQASEPSTQKAAAPAAPAPPSPGTPPFAAPPPSSLPAQPATAVMIAPTTAAKS